MSRKTKLLAVALTAIMVLSVFAYAPAAASADASTQANTLLVDDDHGADHNDDIDNDNEYETIQGAVNDAEPGDTIEVAAGTYNENVMVDVGDIVIQGAGASQVTVLGVGNGNATMTLGADDIEFRGFTVQANKNAGTPALKIYDLIQDSHVKGVLVENNVFVGHDSTKILAMATPPNGNSQARDLLIRNNEFTGGTVGSPSMNVGLHLNARSSTLESNTFSTKVDWASLKVTGPHNTINDTTIEYPGYAYSGMWITRGGQDTTVNTLSVDGHLDEHLHQDSKRGDWLKYGVVVEGSGSTLSNVDAHQSHIGIYIGGNYDGKRYVTDVTLLDSMGDENRNHDLKIKNAKRVLVDDFDALSSVMPKENEWSNFRGSHPTSGANVFAHYVKKSTLRDVTSRSSSPIGIAMLETYSSTVDAADIANKYGGPTDLWRGDNTELNTDPATGIAIGYSSNTTVSNSLVENNDVGIGVYASYDTDLVGNNPGIYNNTHAGVDVQYSEDTLLRDNDVQDNGIGLNVKKSEDTDALFNNFVGNGEGIVATHAKYKVDAKLNWFGSDDGPSGSATDGVLSGSGDSIVGPKGKVKYDPFLTAPKDDVIQDKAKTQQFAHDFVSHGSQGVQTIGSPGPASVSFQFSQGSQAMVWTYDGAFNQVTSASTQADTLEGYIITDFNKGEHARVVIDFSDATVGTPGSKSLESGWNFVAAPQYGDTEDVMRSTTEILRVAHGYDQFASQPFSPIGDSSAFNYPMGSDSDGPRLSAFSGYWVYVDGDGELTATIPAGVTYSEEPGLIQDS